MNAERLIEVAESLALVGDAEQVKAFEKLLKSDDPRSRSAGVLALGALGADAPIDQLAARLKDKNLMVAGEAAHALARAERRCGWAPRDG